MNNIKKVLDGIYSNLELRRKVVPLFLGNPGLGKTMIIEEFAKEKGVKLVELITSQMSPFEVSGVCIPDKDTKQMMYYNLDKLENLKTNDILFFDEILNGNPVVLNACLTILEQRRFISGKPLPDIMIIAASNPQGQAPLTPQIKRRFVWYNVKFNASMWKEYMFNKYKLPKVISNKLCNLIKNEKFEGTNFNTPADLDKAVGTILKGIYTPYEVTIKPILDSLIKNEVGTVDCGNGTILQENELIKWLDIARLFNGINITNKKVKTEVSNSYEVVMLDKDDNVLGEIKDLDTLFSMYYFSNESKEELRLGGKLSPLKRNSTDPPLHIAFAEFFFQKK